LIPFSSFWNPWSSILFFSRRCPGVFFEFPPPPRSKRGPTLALFPHPFADSPPPGLSPPSRRFPQPFWKTWGPLHVLSPGPRQAWGDISQTFQFLPVGGSFHFFSLRRFLFPVSLRFRALSLSGRRRPLRFFFSFFFSPPKLPFWSP